MQNGRDKNLFHDFTGNFSLPVLMFSIITHNLLPSMHNKLIEPNSLGTGHYFYSFALLAETGTAPLWALPSYDSHTN